jgi:hypothetical protein
VWILEPFSLNDHQYGRSEIPAVEDLGADYEAYFAGAEIDREPIRRGGVIAVSPVKASARLLPQRSVFTFHANVDTPIDTLAAPCAVKIERPADAVPSAEQFLRLSGISEYALFPDLDGLGRHLRDLYKVSAAGAFESGGRRRAKRRTVKG